MAFDVEIPDYELQDMRTFAELAAIEERDEPPLGTDAPQRTHDLARFARRDVPIAAHVGLDLDRYANLGDALADAIPPNRTRTALIEADRHRETSRSTYNAYAEASTHLQASMQSCDVKAGDRVAILLSNQHSWLTSATAALWAGAVLTPLDYKLDADAQAELLAHAAPRVLITEWATWRKLSAHAARFAETTTWVMPGLRRPRRRRALRVPAEAVGRGRRRARARPA